MNRPTPVTSGRYGRWIDWVVDLAVAVFSTGAAVVLHGEVVALTGAANPAASAGTVVAAVHGASTIVRRRYPIPVLATLVATGALTATLGFPVYMLGPAVLFAMYSAGARLRERPSFVTAVAVPVAVALLVAVGPAYPGPASTLFFSAMTAGAWWLGHLVQKSRTAAEEHARRADELAATREELARYAVSEERRRIARELHDVVAHSMTVVAMHAGTGRLVAAKDPSSAVGSLATVERLSREALQEMRRLVGLLRSGGDDEALAPAPGLNDLHRLVAEVVDAGMAVEVKTAGDLGAVPPGPALAAYRIIQEALTNAVRHSRADRAELGVEVTESGLLIRVTNGPPPEGETAGGPGPGGMGMVGMQERVHLYDGSLTAGPLRDGGYRVEARIPIDLSHR